MQPGCGCSAARLWIFCFRAPGRPFRQRGVESTVPGARARALGAARAPLGGPRGAGKGLHVPGRLAPGRVTCRAGPMTAPGRPLRAPRAPGGAEQRLVSPRGRPRPAKPWAPRPRRRRPGPGRDRLPPRAWDFAAGRTRA